MLRIVLFVIIILSIPAFCSVLVPPDEFFLAGFVSLTIPFFVTFNFIATVYFLMSRSGWFLIPLSILIMASPLFNYSFSFSERKEELKYSLRLVSYNTNALGFYENPSTLQSKLPEFREWVLKQNYDIICLQELAEHSGDSLLLPHYYKFFSGKITEDSSRLGLFIFSRKPFKRTGVKEFAFNSYNRLSWADVAISEDTIIRVVNVHLKSYDLKGQSFRGIVKKIRSGLMARSYHAKLIHQFVSSSPYPVVLCGDLNETPQSYPYLKLRSLLNDVFQGSGKGYQYTFRIFGIPLRIDYVFISDSLVSDEYQVYSDLEWSDHYPVSVRIGWPGRVE